MITRDVAAATQREFDLVVVGGGIYGVSLLQEAARRGLSACLCEAGDFGSGTTWNSLRIVHGGLRYLQTLDLRRFFQSVEARRRLSRQFPTLVRPLKCLMPLYGQGMKRASVMRMALLMNDVLSAHRNAGVPAEVHLPGGAILDASATRRVFPQVRGDGLEGAASWTDAFMLSSERVVMELLRDACRHGAVALNYAPVTEIVSEGGRARGVRIRDRLSGVESTLRGRTIVNCAGPQVRALAEGQGGDTEELFRPSLAFNLLLDVHLPVDSALAVAAPQPGAPVLFVVPQPGTVLAGTMHLPRPAGTTEAAPTEAEIAGYLELLNQAIPGLGAGPGNVRRVFAGLLPATRIGSADIAKREVLRDHGAAGGLAGLYTVAGVKFTTANDVARQVLSLTGGASISALPEEALPTAAETPVLLDGSSLRGQGRESLRASLMRVMSEESVHSVDDLVLRRTNWATTEPDLEASSAWLGELLSLPREVPLAGSREVAIA
jgi:glycerol-3-phosphate dehydrogenase